MTRRYFLKGQSSLQRKAIAGGLTATFAFGTVGNGFAGAMEQKVELDLEKLEEKFNLETEKKIYDYSNDDEKRAKLIKKGIYPRYLNFRLVKDKY